MPKPSDQLIPGSERAYEIVNDRLMRDIVKDLGHGPARLPSVHPDAQAPRAEAAQPVPLKPPSGIGLIDRMCLAQDAQDRLAKIEVLARTVANFQAAHDAKVEIKRLEAEVVRLKEEVKKAAEAAKPKS